MRYPLLPQRTLLPQNEPLAGGGGWVKGEGGGMGASGAFPDGSGLFPTVRGFSRHWGGHFANIMFLVCRCYFEREPRKPIIAQKALAVARGILNTGVAQCPAALWYPSPYQPANQPTNQPRNKPLFVTLITVSTLASYTSIHPYGHVSIGPTGTILLPLAFWPCSHP